MQNSDHKTYRTVEGFNKTKVLVSGVLKVQLLGKNFPNPIGLAAGFDKSAEAYNSLLRLGFGFVEVGTVTPLKQFGNPKPRIFRLKDDYALINRLGFNNDGIEIIKNRIKSDGKKGSHIAHIRQCQRKEVDTRFRRVGLRAPLASVEALLDKA